MYYVFFCLSGYFFAKYFKYFVNFLEVIYLFLGDCIIEVNLVRVEILFDFFYSRFLILYGEGSCGFNVYNVGVYLVFYVRFWGFIFVWSCFGFEDWNVSIL